MFEKTLCKRKKIRETKLLSEILSGDLKFIKKTIYLLYGTSVVNSLRSLRTYREMKMIEEDICQDIFEALYVKSVNGSLDDVKYPKSYIKRVIFYKFVDEIKRVQKYVSINFLEQDYYY
jgi:hypothetical protein